MPSPSARRSATASRPSMLEAVIVTAVSLVVVCATLATTLPGLAR